MADKKELETYGSGISDDIRDQLNSRKSLVAKPGKTVEELQALNSNVAWIRLRSSVNVLDPQVTKTLKDVQKDSTKKVNSIGTSALAKQFTLVGGSHPGNQARSGINFDTGYSNEKIYNIDSVTGHRPMPGITSAKISSKNTLGTLQVAEISFNVWSLQELEDFEILFFRPGYSAILEWGHSIVINTNTTNSTFRYTGRDTGTGGIKDEDFFDKSRTFESLESSINSYKKQGDGNYDGFLGYITNFSWTFRNDGGYDCTVKLVSKGQVLESMSAGKSTDAFSPDSADSKERDTKGNKTVIHRIFEVLEQEKSNAQFEGKAQLRKKITGTKLINKLKDFYVFRYPTQIKNGGTFGFFDKDTNACFVTLGTVLDIFNNFITIHNPKNSEKLIEFDIDAKDEYRTYPNHFAIDPLLSFLPKLPQSAPYSTFISDVDGYNAQTLASKHIPKAKSNRITNILVSTHYVKQAIDKVIDTPQELGVGIMDAIKGILAGIEDNLGGINSFAVTRTSDNVKFKIVDTNKVTTKGKVIPSISLTGLESTILDINLSSKISSQIASQVSIAAQGNAGNYKDNVSAILSWNRGAVDRHFPSKEVTTIEENEANVIEERRNKFLKEYEKAYKSYRNGNEYDNSTWSDFKSEASSEISTQYRATAPDTSLGVVPVELTITMLGLSGWKIGTTFKIEKGLLPSAYSRFGYIVTGVEHEIGIDNKWITIIKTQFFPVD